MKSEVDLLIIDYSFLSVLSVKLHISIPNYVRSILYGAFSEIVLYFWKDELLKPVLLSSSWWSMEKSELSLWLIDFLLELFFNKNELLRELFFIGSELFYGDILSYWRLFTTPPSSPIWMTLFYIISMPLKP